MSQPIGYYKKKDKRGKTVTHPVTRKTRVPYSPPAMKVVKLPRRKPLWEAIEEADAKRLEERERRLREQNERARQKLEVQEIVALCNSSDPVTAAMGKAELKQKYTDVYEEMFKKGVSEREQQITPEREKIAHEPLEFKLPKREEKIPEEIVKETEQAKVQREYEEYLEEEAREHEKLIEEEPETEEEESIE